MIWRMSEGRGPDRVEGWKVGMDEWGVPPAVR